MCVSSLRGTSCSREFIDSFSTLYRSHRLKFRISIFKSCPFVPWRISRIKCILRLISCLISSWNSCCVRGNSCARCLLHSTFYLFCLSSIQSESSWIEACSVCSSAFDSKRSEATSITSSSKSTSFNSPRKSSSWGRNHRCLKHLLMRQVKIILFKLNLRRQVPRFVQSTRV